MQKINEMNNNIIDEIISQINENYCPNIHNLPFADEKKRRELNFMKRKREDDDFNFIFQKDINFTISCSNTKFGNIKQKNESKNARSISQSYLINLGANSCKNIFNESSDRSNLKESNKININEDNNNNFTKIKKFEAIKNISDKDLFGSINNNEIQVLKNNKKVYIDRYFLKSYSNLRSLKKLKQYKFIVKNKTSSKYRGVSKNGKKWQVLIRINNKNSYIGSFLSEEMAARVYDILAIKNRGIKARTNFIYNNIQKNKIYESKINIESDNISDFIMQLIN